MLLNALALIASYLSVALFALLLWGIARLIFGPAVFLFGKKPGKKSSRVKTE